MHPHGGLCWRCGRLYGHQIGVRSGTAGKRDVGPFRTGCTVHPRENLGSSGKRFTANPKPKSKVRVELGLLLTTLLKESGVSNVESASIPTYPPFPRREPLYRSSSLQDSRVVRRLRAHLSTPLATPFSHHAHVLPGSSASGHSTTLRPLRTDRASSPGVPDAPATVPTAHQQPFHLR
jgi:hypothetical protein